MDEVPDYGLVFFPSDSPPFKVMYNASHANMSLADYIEMYRGPKQLSMTWVIPITILYTIIFITGVIGNGLVCLVIARNRHMHNPTNFYLFSLSISDLTLLLLGLPNDLQIYWRQYPWQYGLFLCKARAVVSEWSTYSSVVVIVAFSVERYLAICQPFKTYKMSTLQRSRRVIAGVWIFSFFSALPIAYLSKLYYLEFPPDSGLIVHESAFCATLLNVRPGDADYVPIYEVSGVMFFLLPMALIAYMYIKIYLTLRARERNSIRRPSRREENAKKQIITMLAAVVVTFFVCWAPFHLQRLFIMHMTNHPHYQKVNEWLYYITGVFYYLSATMNPLLYSALSKKFRDAFRRTLFCSRRSPFEPSNLLQHEPPPTSGAGTARRQRFDMEMAPIRVEKNEKEVPEIILEQEVIAQIEVHKEKAKNGASPSSHQTTVRLTNNGSTIELPPTAGNQRTFTDFLPIIRATAKETYI